MVANERKSPMSQERLLRFCPLATGGAGFGALEDAGASFALKRKSFSLGIRSSLLVKAGKVKPCFTVVVSTMFASASLCVTPTHQYAATSASDGQSNGLSFDTGGFGTGNENITMSLLSMTTDPKRTPLSELVFFVDILDK